eukprot:TRINITY_DN1183_c0_g1_i2.p1 TRINITY_DN1183_c0_g1~~TRINITY_DN1183_c0_g1_i2.p1  ORF type:complete len:157 (+),score=34.70 TRINITY_DN1183_c0_g1_i2:443-913(+)
MEVDGVRSVLNIYDTAGVEDFPIVKDGYMREADGFLCVYAVNSPESFEEVSKLHGWVMRVKENRRVPFVLCGNKVDLGESKRLVTTEEGETLAKDLNIQFLETSALTGKNIEQAFGDLVREIRKENKEEEGRAVEAPSNASTSKNKGTKKCACVLI